MRHDLTGQEAQFELDKIPFSYVAKFTVGSQAVFHMEKYISFNGSGRDAEGNWNYRIGMADAEEWFVSGFPWALIVKNKCKISALDGIGTLRVGNGDALDTYSGTCHFFQTIPNC